MGSTISQMPQPPVSFPHEENLVITIRIRTATPEDRGYFMDENGIQAGFLLDLFDMMDMVKNHIITINGKTQREYTDQIQGNMPNAV